MEEWERLKDSDPDYYKHHILGEWRNINEGQVFTNWLWQYDPDPEELQYLQEMAVELIAMCEQGEPKAAWDKLEGENLDAEQKIALWTLLPSKVRSALKKAKEI